jgi:DNA invertase Pin-like site-specific DNA recombinase
VRFGYIRFSTDTQSADPQLLRLQEAGIDRIFADEAVSGRKADRPELAKMLDMLRPGDVVVAVRLDRLGRSVKNLIELFDRIEKAGADVQILDQQIDTRTPMGRFIFHVLAALGQMEADLIRERTLDGLAAARARGHMGGRPKSYTEQQCNVARMLRDAGEMKAPEIADLLGVSRASYFRMLKDYGESQAART